MAKRFYTVKALAELFDKHENTIYTWITEDRLFPNAFKVKDGWYVPGGDVERLMRQGRVNGTENQGADGRDNPRAERGGGGFVKGWK